MKAAPWITALAMFGSGVPLAAQPVARPLIATFAPSTTVTTASGSAAAEVQDAGAFEGRVAAYLLSPEAGVAGLLLDDGRQVRVPPWVGSALAALVGPGQRVRIGARHPEDELSGPADRRSITSIESGQTLSETALDASSADAGSARDAVAPLRLLQTRGIIRFNLFGPRGEANGLVLDNGVQVAFPPHVMREIGGHLLPGTRVEVEGYGRTSAWGTILQATTINAPNLPPFRVYGPANRP